ncbi:cell surface composition regulator GlgS [Shimwellia blattae]|uniref:Surface composition regulator n=1 Tax=Shimwellia blattae (strain ATCC 29907 / DSM 4481 / JCM 1650 / NBRC 105725 / CDC 9005-74) TaxID=630626 RepID=I2B566_SHIBC|nr:cell surface composition regulator GlgS [Shimwellia blattae]AFJ45670.1 RpoS dependent glycogen biosynthesis protein [Shimwellia blattae DSM 4481 = NBRC 105725]GAB82119.1 glycogen synthesis protein GlgS [Shimwellia blattae DSM 4481 = NBRC 105725]VDY63152.1 Glycogen synthesis protein glgS [Shimwellia blattae]VEC20770.1 Glycogen synthesis protein glgS [Shimwellia blattae]
MNNNALYSLENFDFLARTFARMHNQGRRVDINAVTGNMDEAHRQWFCKRYALYCRKEATVKSVALEAGH